MRLQPPRPPSPPPKGAGDCRVQGLQPFSETNIANTKACHQEGALDTIEVAFFV